MDDNFIFIQGVGRVGSKIYLHILNSADDVKIMGEMNFSKVWQKDMLDLYKKHNQLREKEDVVRFVNSLYDDELQATFWKNVDKNNFNRDLLITKILNSDRRPKDILYSVLKTFSNSNSVKRTGAKFPASLAYTEKLLSWYPNSKVIHLTRDPRALIESHSRGFIHHVKNGIPGIKNIPNVDFLIRKFLLLRAILMWHRSTVIHERLKDHERYYLSRFEDIVSNPEEFIPELCDFLDIEVKEDMFYPPVRDSSYDIEKERGFDEEAIYRWKNKISSFDLGLVNIFTKGKRKKLGYS